MDHQVSMRESGHESVRHAKAPHLRRLEVRDALKHTSEQRPTIRPVTSSERGAALHVINTAAEWYREFLRSEEHQPTEMDEAGWDGEAQRMTWWGAFLDGLLVGVMGCEPARDAVLMRHAAVPADRNRHKAANPSGRRPTGPGPDSNRNIHGQLQGPWPTGTSGIPAVG